MFRLFFPLVLMFLLTLFRFFCLCLFSVFSFRFLTSRFFLMHLGRRVLPIHSSNTVNYVAVAPVNLKYVDGTVLSNNIFKGTGGRFE